MLLVLFVGVLQAQDRMSFRAASSDPVAGWQRMTLEDKVVWVSPEVSLTSADVSRAQPIAQPDGKKAMAMELTDDGASKMRRLSAAQNDKLIAMVLGEQLIWAPRVRSELGKQFMLTGNGPNGMSDDVIQRILAALK
jgi:preprotein translocase subunit SecD